MTADAPSTALKALLAVLDLEQIEDNLFRGARGSEGWQRVYGGQVLGQALMAALRTVDPARSVHSLHGDFLLAGDPSLPIIYDVERTRDGGSFTTRRVKAIQHGAAIFTMSASFHKLEEGLEHQSAMPDVPAPEALPNPKDLIAGLIDKLPAAMRSYWERDRPIDMRVVDISRYLDAREEGARPANLVPRGGAAARRSGRASGGPRLCLRLHAPGHGPHRARQAPVRRRHPARKPRPFALVPPAIPRRRVDALRAGQPECSWRARFQPGEHLYPRGRADRVGGAGGPDAAPQHEVCA